MKVNDKSLIKMARDYAWTYDLDEFSFRLPGSTDEIVLSRIPESTRWGYEGRLQLLRAGGFMGR